ncbi:MAG: hypothetical protein EZS28_010205 [Streblomastix strix]|uniref:Uncharacterized protein n=1 Tax=Streblomastix strix TaxID=222440 RepID=A0A5J4WIS9_9EUKA|nr:MAG: hypothetical protein EZS28_010205 [Streblomastix strix]
MPPKKKGKGKKKKKSKTPEILPVPFDYTHPEDVAEEWVNLNVRLLSWTYLDFTYLVSTQTKLYTVIERIKEQHRGTIREIEIYREKKSPNCLLSDPFATLDQLGIKGGTKDHPSTITLLYDFRADHIPQSVDVFLSNPNIPPRISSNQLLKKKLAQSASSKSQQPFTAFQPQIQSVSYQKASTALPAAQQTNQEKVIARQEQIIRSLKAVLEALQAQINVDE